MISSYFLLATTLANQDPPPQKIIMIPTVCVVKTDSEERLQFPELPYNDKQVEELAQKHNYTIKWKNGFTILFSPKIWGSHSLQNQKRLYSLITSCKPNESIGIESFSKEDQESLNLAFEKSWAKIKGEESKEWRMSLHTVTTLDIQTEQGDQKSVSVASYELFHYDDQFELPLAKNLQSSDPSGPSIFNVSGEKSFSELNIYFPSDFLNKARKVAAMNTAMDCLDERVAAIRKEAKEWQLELCHQLLMNSEHHIQLQDKRIAKGSDLTDRMRKNVYYRWKEADINNSKVQWTNSNLLIVLTFKSEEKILNLTFPLSEIFPF